METHNKKWPNIAPCSLIVPVGDNRRALLPHRSTSSMLTRHLGHLVLLSLRQLPGEPHLHRDSLTVGDVVVVRLQVSNLGVGVAFGVPYGDLNQQKRWVKKEARDACRRLGT